MLEIMITFSISKANNMLKYDSKKLKKLEILIEVQKLMKLKTHL